MGVDLTTWDTTPDTSRCRHQERHHLGVHARSRPSADRHQRDRGPGGLQARPRTRSAGTSATTGSTRSFEWTDPETGNVYTLRDYSIDPTRYKGNSTGPGAVGAAMPIRAGLLGILPDLYETLQQQLGPHGQLQLFEGRGSEPALLLQSTSPAGRGLLRLARRGRSQRLRQRRQDAGRRPPAHPAPGRQRRAAVRVQDQLGGQHPERSNLRPIPAGCACRDGWHLSTSSPSRPATTNGSRPSTCGISASASTSTSARGRTSASTSRSSTCSTTTRSTGGETTRTRLARSRCPGGWVLPRRAELRFRFTF